MKGKTMAFKTLSVKETAALLGVSHQRVRRLIHTGRLPAGRDVHTGVLCVFCPVWVRPGKRGPRFRNIAFIAQ